MTVINNKITITGASGFVGRILQSGLRKQGYEIDVFDPMKGVLVDMLRSRPLGTSPSRLSRYLARNSGKVSQEPNGC